MKFKGYSREYTDAKMRRAAAEFRNGRTVEEICKIIDVDLATIDEWAVTPYRMREQLNNSPLLDCVCPLFWMPRDRDRMEQIGSGVLLRLADEVFLLSAAHVIDYSEAGDLYIPGQKQILPVNGHYADMPVLSGESRDSDKVDMAYYRLSPKLRTELHSSFRPLNYGDLRLTDRPIEGDLYSYVGYPWRKTETIGVVQHSERFTFSGEIVSLKMYRTLGYKPVMNYVIQFRRHKSFNAATASILTAPHPQGISGGAIFAWPKEVDNEPDIPAIKLVGICHTYHEKQHCMVGTHVNPYILSIQKNNPELGPEQLAGFNTNCPSEAQVDHRGKDYHWPNNWHSR